MNPFPEALVRSSPSWPAKPLSLVSRSRYRGGEIFLIGVLLVVALLASPSLGDEVRSFPDPETIRLSFLDSTEVVNDTISKLRTAGCSEVALKGFERFLISQRELFSVSRAQLEGASENNLSFASVEDLSGMSPPRFPSLVHHHRRPAPHSLMCFDVAMLLLREGPVEAPHVWNGFAEKRFVSTSLQSQGGVFRLLAEPATTETFAGGHRLLSSLASYRRWTGGARRSEGEETLALSLRATRQVPGHYVNSEVALKALFNTRVDTWKRDGVVFSESLQIVLGHFVDLKRRLIGADHVGILIPAGHRWMYLEKNGTANPLIRIDFRNQEEVADYILSIFEADRYNPRSPLHRAAFLVSINDRLFRTCLRTTGYLDFKSPGNPISGR